MFDNQVIQSLRKSAGPSVMSLVLMAFVSDCRSARDSLEEALAKSDEALARRTGHKLKGLLLQYGCTGANVAAHLADASADEWRSLSQQMLKICELLEPEAERLARQGN